MRWTCSLLVVLACTLTLSLVGCGGSDNNTVAPSPTASAGTQFAGNWSGTFHVDTSLLLGLPDNPNTDVDESQQKVAIGGPATVAVSSSGSLSAEFTNIAGESVGVLTPSAKGTIQNVTVGSDGAFTGTITTESGTDLIAGTLVFPQGTTDQLYITLVQTHGGVRYSGNVVLIKN